MSISPLRFVSAIKAADGARALIARDTARAQKFLAGVQPHGPKAHKSLEHRRRGAGHVQGHDQSRSHDQSRGHGRGHDQEFGRRLDVSSDPQTTVDTIDVTDAGLLGPPFSHIARTDS
jgi:hypothetical protein